MARIFLGALGWVGETPVGNRLRWAVPVDEEIDGQFLGLPSSVIVERSILPPGPLADSDLLDAPTWPIPLDWWEELGALPVPVGVGVRVDLPKTVQAVHFIYQGPETLFRAIDEPGEVVTERRIAPGDMVLIELAEIAALEFLIGGGVMTQTRVLDLFAGHDTGIDYEQIALLGPRATTGMTLEEAEARLSAPSDLDADEWTEFQEEIVAQALVSTPDTPTFEDSGLTRWAQFRMLMSVRWRLSLLYGLGFLDGPDAGEGASPDQIESGLLLQELPTRPHVYRVRCLFEDHPEMVSNPIVVQPMLASPLQVPQDLGYDRARVRLFDEAEYELDARLSMGANDRRVIGCEIEEEIGPSAILGGPLQADSYLFQSWQPADWHSLMRMERTATLPFYDLPIRFRARSIDGWDRLSAWAAWTPERMPDFVHSPLPPPLMDAQFTTDGETRIYPRTPANRFTEWEPDHAAANTPGTMLEVMRRVAEPEVTEVGISEPVFEHSGPEDPVDRFRAFFSAPLAQPDRFAGGSLIAGTMRAAIAEIDASSVLFRPIGDGGDTAAMPGPGPALLQQTPTHPDLFTVVTSIGIHDLPGIVAFTDTLPAPDGATAIDYFAVRVEMGIATGGLSNLVSTLRHPQTPPVPPPFLVELMGVDFYGRTMMRLRFVEPAPSGTYVVCWADGTHEASDFHDLAIEGDYGPQTPMDGLELFEVFSMPVPANLERIVTVGVQAKTAGGFVSPYSTLPVSLPVYEQ